VRSTRKLGAEGTTVKEQEMAGWGGRRVRESRLVALIDWPSDPCAGLELQVSLTHPHPCPCPCSSLQNTVPGHGNRALPRTSMARWASATSCRRDLWDVTIQHQTQRSFGGSLKFIYILRSFQMPRWFFERS
jgi:hypothetical protein